MKHALVTGGAGFIGSHLTELLLSEGHRVTVVDDLSTSSEENLAAAIGSKNLRFVRGSICDAGLMSALMDDVDEVYHLAAAVGVSLVARRPIDSIRRNIGPFELLLEIIHARIQAGDQITLFLASSSEVYGKNPKATWMEEDDLVLGPTTRSRWSYGAAKAIDEFLALAYSREHGLPVVIGRLFNVVGPRQTGAYGMVLPRFVEAAVRGQPILVHDDGQQVRCFAHVRDVVRAIVALVNSSDASGRVFNIGSDHPTTILDLAKTVASRAGGRSSIQFQSYSEAFGEDFDDVRRRVPDLSRLKSTIDVESKYDLAGIVKELVTQRAISQESGE